MKLAIPVWQDRVSPVFDVAGQLLLVEFEASEEIERRQESLPEESTEQRIHRLQNLGVGTLICGAISRPLEALLASAGIRIVSQVCGNVEEVLQAFRSGKLEDDRFAMPGCCGRRRRRQHGRCRRGGQTAGDYP
jgi:predicted Fe-Mo cluster-binding NifX family protein